MLRIVLCNEDFSIGEEDNILITVQGQRVRNYKTSTEFASEPNASKVNFIYHITLLLRLLR